MKMALLDMVWPAIYVYAELWRFWFLVIGTIVIEAFTIYYFLKFSIRKSLLVSLVGNFTSGLIGTFLMMWAMLAWHFVADRFMPQATFDITNWIATYILMCVGSVFIETIIIKLLFKSSIKELFLPLLVGNLLTYGFIGYVMATNKEIY
jgi:hypothetical protein